MHVLSLTAPQHPKKAITNTIDPTMIRSVGANSKLSGMASVASLRFSLYSTPIISSANPASCKKEEMKH